MINEKPEYYSEVFVGKLAEMFKSGVYPIIEGINCTQYLQEYVPLHLPRIAHSLVEPLKKDNMGKINVKNECCVLDICSGPATVALGICEIFDSSVCDIKFNITTVEASNGFNNMIDIFKSANSNKNVNIANNLDCSVEEFATKRAERRKGKFDWIIIANGISSMGKSSLEVNNTLDDLLTKLLNPEQKAMLTVIEGSGKLRDGVSLRECIENLNFSHIKILETLESGNCQISIPWIKNCKIYRTKYGNYKPYVNSKSLLLELKNE